jgi:galactokinase
VNVVWQFADEDLDDERAGDAASELPGALSWLVAHGGFFDPSKPLLLSRAPGRLDLMGGFADYSGSLVLELPLQIATWVAAQVMDDPHVVIDSAAANDTGGESRVTMSLDDVTPPVAPLTYAQARALLTGDPRRTWAAYVAGALVALHREYGRRPQQGLKLLVRSDVPPGKGVSSSAALEIAALEVLATLAGVTIDDRALALLAQKMENLIVGAPCGVMDQMTACSGRKDHLIEILCQPAELRGHIRLPPALEVFGIDSGIRHAVSGSDYGRVRTAAFMGYRIIADAAGLIARPSGPERVTIDDPLFHGYLANVSPADWDARFHDVVPAQVSGQAFLDRYGGFTDGMTTIDPARTYDVRVCTAHPIHEHARVTRFRDLLIAGAADEASRHELGAIMSQSHDGYSACGLGSDGTDRLVELVRAAGPQAGLYGAKVTGGGSGGSVAVLARRGSIGALKEIAGTYARATGRNAEIFMGSSTGARGFGVRRLLSV